MLGIRNHWIRRKEQRAITDYGLVVGGVDQGRSFERLVDLVAGVTGATVREVPGESQSVVGTLAGGHAWVGFDGLTDLVFGLSFD